MFPFSREFGKVKGVAKGIGQPKSKLGGKIELFNLIEGDYYKKETSELGIISSAHLLEDFRSITSTPRKFGFASAWCEILDKISHSEQPHPETFELTFDYFKALEKSEVTSSGPLFWSALLRLLAIEGCAPQVEACISCGNQPAPVTAGNPARLTVSVERGGLICGDCINPEEPTISISHESWKILAAMTNDDFGQISKMTISPRAGQQAADLIISFASYHLGLPRNLKSFKFLENLGEVK